MSQRRQTSFVRGKGASVGFTDRLLAESVRALEHDGAAAIDEGDAEQSAIAGGGDFEKRIVLRAGSLSIAGEMRTALRHVDRTTVTIVALLVVLALVAGAGAGRVLLDVDRETPVNFFRLVGALVGVQTVLLMAWLIVMLLKPAALASGSLGAVALGGSRWLAAKFHKGPTHTAALQANGVVLARSPVGRWTLGAISHGVWVAFSAGALVLVTIMLSTGHYLFTWETTILSADTYRSLIRAVAWLPDAMGVPTPSEQQIAEAQWPIDPQVAASAQRVWGNFLIGSIVVYGLLPRMLLLGFCVQRRSRAKACWRLDTTRPGYLRLQSKLMPQTTSLGIVDADGAQDQSHATAAVATTATNTTRDVGPPAILGLEIDKPQSTWPPQINGVAWNDLGFVDDGNDRRRALDQLTQPAAPPRIVVIVSALTTTPDRGIGAFVQQIQTAAGCPIGLVLTGGQLLRDRGDVQLMESRIDDWRNLAAGVGVAAKHVMELDLDHLTEASLANLAQLVGVEHEQHTSRHVEAAFDLILDHYRDWHDAPTIEKQTDLHRAIGALYRDQHDSWRKLLGAPLDLKGDLTAPLRTAAHRVTNLLPPRLRLDARWMACGALTGALGCVAAATLLSPVAIAGLPMWTAIGAAIATVTKAFMPADTDTNVQTPTNSNERSDALRTAALFALLLEVQGRDEVAITRILDRTLPEDGDLAVDSADTARVWLDDLRHRFDIALTKETSA